MFFNPSRFLSLLSTIVLAGALTPCAYAHETERVYISGHDKDDAVPWKFMVTSGAKANEWTTIPVPSNWEMQGFGKLNYRKDSKDADMETGLYEREFPAPARWQDKRVFLVFEGVMTDADAKFNGQSVGPKHQGGYYRFKYEVTQLVKVSATNKLEVTVAKHSANQSVNDAERVAVNAQADGSFDADVFPNGVANGSEIEAQIQSLDGQDVGAPFVQKITGDKVSVKGKVVAPKLWTAETPNLYQAKFRLKQDGKTFHEYTQRFGFRTFEVRDGDGFYLNGNRIVLKGANRHSTWPESGRVLSDKIHRLDIETLKDANMNAARMSHYPPDERFLDLCDELGIYVLDELTGWHQYYDDDVGAKLVREMVTRDVNHPSILLWDNGNEDSFNLTLDPIFGQFDPQQRRVLHPWTTFSGVNASHYLIYGEAETASDGVPIYASLNTKDYLTIDRNDPKKYIYMPTEFQHGLFDGGAGAGMEDCWKLMSTSKYCAGGFVWSLIDDDMKRPDGKMDTAGNQAPDGIVGPYREREGSFYTIKELWSPIVITRDASGALTVENHYGFTEASQCKFTWQLRKFTLPNEAETKEGFTIVQEGVAPSPKIAPGGKGRLDLHLPNPVPAAVDALAVRAEDPSGRELWTWVWPFPAANRFAELLQAEGAQHATATETADVIEVKAGELTVTFNKQTGLLTGVRRSGQIFSLTNGPVFTGGASALASISSETAGSACMVTAKFTGPMKSIVWRVGGNGWIECNFTYIGPGKCDLLGVTFDYPENAVQHKGWLGDGPFRVWKNRLRGVSLNVWQNDYNDTLTGLRDWIYPEFKGFFANVRWLQLTTSEGDITVIPKNVQFVQVLTPGFALEKTAGKAIAPVAKGGLAFLQGISPIGSKFKPADETGPQGQLNDLTGDFSGSVSFYFGKLRSAP
jgi:hypothetical protein